MEIKGVPSVKITDTKLPRGNYKSPVEVMISEAIEKANEETESEILHQVEITTGIHINKEELIKALNYDRDQFQKGWDCAFEKIYEKLKRKMSEPFADEIMRIINEEE